LLLTYKVERQITALRKATQKDPQFEPYERFLLAVKKETIEQWRKAQDPEIDEIFAPVSDEPRPDPFLEESSTPDASNGETVYERGVGVPGGRGFADLEDQDIFENIDEETRKLDPRNRTPEFPVLKYPQDPELQKALPRGFHDMTFEEQQEELWIVYSEKLLGTKWPLPPKGEKHREYVDDYPAYSPPKVLGMLYRWRARKWRAHEWRLARAIALNRSLRLPVLATQAFLRRHALLARRRGVAVKIETYLGTTEEWKARVAELEATTGITEADIKQWVWILSPQSGDLKIQRFLASECRKPFFLVMLLLAKDKTIKEPAVLMGLLKYIRENYILRERPEDEMNHPAYKEQGRAMSWWHFLVLLYRLVWHVREEWPAVFPVLAHMTAEFIQTIPVDSQSRSMTGAQARSVVLNKALQYFAWPARIRPLVHMEHNWAAQRYLLRLATSSEPPLVIMQNGYRAIRQVLIALSKTKGEARNVERASKTWPPYRRAVDGMDERRPPEDDLSRSSKAGILVREAGYADEFVDRTLSALGGSLFGDSPTIQSRALSPPFFYGSRAGFNIFVEWAAQVKATRNAREAWIVFLNPPEPGLRPDLRVYAEMFDKLFARPVSDHPAIRPGDVKEVFPVHDGNLSKFEIARLTPPTPDELYDMMLQDKLRPAGKCLAILVRNAPSKQEALRYLRDSPFAAYIDPLMNRLKWHDAESMKTLARLPPPIFNAWIRMLCRTHMRKTGEVRLETNKNGLSSQDTTAEMVINDPHLAGEDRVLERQIAKGYSILEAIALTRAFQTYNKRSAYGDKQPWHTIMEALAGPKVLYSRFGALFNPLETLTVFLEIYQRTTISKGVDPIAFEALCVMMRKTLMLSTFVVENGKLAPRQFIAYQSPVENQILRAHRLAREAFRDLVNPVPAEEATGESPDTQTAVEDIENNEMEQFYEEDDWPPKGLLRYNVTGRPLFRYMMALGCCGDWKEMVRLMDWILDGWDGEYIHEEAKSPHDIMYHYMIRTFAYFIRVGGYMVPHQEMERLRVKLEELRMTRECTWFWPTGEDLRRMEEEFETDLIIREKWTRLPQMIFFADPENKMEMLAELIPKGADKWVTKGQLTQEELVRELRRESL